MKVAVLLKKSQRRVSIADEHDGERITAYCRELNGKYGIGFEVVYPEQRAVLANGSHYGGFLFIGTDSFTLDFITHVSQEDAIFIWAKGYELTIDPMWSESMGKVKLFFNSAYYGSVEEPYHRNTHYLPTAFHHVWPQSWRERLAEITNLRVDMTSFDLVFSGSDRCTRRDMYRQRLLNKLVQRGFKICVAAPRWAWNREHQTSKAEQVALHPSIRLLGNWGTPKVFSRAKCVLDLPWLDSVFSPPHDGVNNSVWALGWNIFRAGAYGANVLTYDCPANRHLGLNEENCLFYQTGIENLDALADEIYKIVANLDKSASETRRARVKNLFHAQHRYIDRWDYMCREILNYYQLRETRASTHPVRA